MTNKDLNQEKTAPVNLPIQPARFDKIKEDNEITVSWRWRSDTAKLLFWGVWLVGWWTIIVMFIQPDPTADVELTIAESWVDQLLSWEWWWGLFPMPLLHIVIGLAVAYIFLANLVNSTEMSIDKNHLRVKHGPLPWRSPAVLELSAVTSFSSRSTLEKRTTKRKRYEQLIASTGRFNSVSVLTIRNANATEEIDYLVALLNRNQA